MPLTEEFVHSAAELIARGKDIDQQGFPSPINGDLLLQISAMNLEVNLEILKTLSQIKERSG